MGHESGAYSYIQGSRESRFDDGIDISVPPSTSYTEIRVRNKSRRPVEVEIEYRQVKILKRTI